MPRAGRSQQTAAALDLLSVIGAIGAAGASPFCVAPKIMGRCWRIDGAAYWVRSGVILVRGFEYPGLTRWPGFGNRDC